jgi:hypothetical protein
MAPTPPRRPGKTVCAMGPGPVEAGKRAHARKPEIWSCRCQRLHTCKGDVMSHLSQVNAKLRQYLVVVYQMTWREDPPDQKSLFRASLSSADKRDEPATSSQRRCIPICPTCQLRLNLTLVNAHPLSSGRPDGFISTRCSTAVASVAGRARLTIPACSPP